MIGTSLLEIVKKRTSEATGLSIAQLDKFPYESKNVLHDPFLYDQMDELVDALHDYKLEQKKDPKSLLIVDTDYDTDGIMAACVMSASLDVLGINYRVYSPNMIDGYGLSTTAIDKMKKQFEYEGYHIGLILTADNGTNATEGIEYAHRLGIPVYVTDHHLTTYKNAPAKIIVNPNKSMPDGSKEPYPFDGNAGGTVIWKVMLAYASKYDKSKYDLIYDLIVFAGIANVADVMPITNENHYIVKQAVNELRILWNIYDSHKEHPYKQIKDTKYPHYNAVFHGLFDLIKQMQDSYNARRLAVGKKAYPLPRDEEFISWYLAPALNAPRRVVGSSSASMQALIALNPTLRIYSAKQLISMNIAKTEMRNEILDAIKQGNIAQNDTLIDQDYIANGNAHSLFVNAKHGISGLVAGQIANMANTATIVFALPTNNENKIYNDLDIHNLLMQYPDLIISASARSVASQPLNVIINRIRVEHPEIEIGGGGHALAAGYSIHLSDFKQFCKLFNETVKTVEAEYKAEYEKAVWTGKIKPQILNNICLSFESEDSTPDYEYINLHNIRNAQKQLLDVYNFEQTLKPFGHDFNAESQFYLKFNLQDLNKMKLDRSFWKTFKFNLSGIDCITFDVDKAKQMMQDLDDGLNDTYIMKAKLNMNEFRGHKKLQFILE